MNQKMETQINSISRDEFLENIGVAAIEIMADLKALKRPNLVAILAQEVSNEPIDTDEFALLRTKNNSCRKVGFESIVSSTSDDDINFALSVVKGLRINPYKDDLKPNLGDVYFIGLASPFGKFHGYIQNKKGSRAAGGAEIEIRFIEIESVCEPTSDLAHTK